MHAFGAQFAEVRVREDSGEIEVPRLLGVLRGRADHQLRRPARSQMIGGMTMGLSMALHETGVLDRTVRSYGQPGLRRIPHRQPTRTSVRSRRTFLDEEDPYVNPMGSKGVGELGIVGTAAAIANATFHASRPADPRPADHPGQTSPIHRPVPLTNFPIPTPGRRPLRQNPGKEVLVAACEVCGNDYWLSFEVNTAGGGKHVFDSFECAVQRLAPVC